MIRDLSFRYCVPLNLSLVVLATGLSIAGIVLWHDLAAVRDDAQHSGAQLGRLLAHALSYDLAVEDTWQAYRTLMSLFQDAGDTWLAPDHALVLDGEGYTILASDPFRFPLALPAKALDGDLARMLVLFADLPRSGRTFEGEDLTYQLIPIRAGEVRQGTLVLAFSNQRLWPRFYRSAAQVLAATAMILLVLLPLGWLLGRRLAEPLTELEGCVARLGEDDASLPTCVAPESGDELGRLRSRIESVARALQEKRALERQVIRTRRQTALGRLAAGMAHEINNPLGGMFTAIAIFKRHGREPKVAEQTISLLERGLEQIRHIVSALLVEVKATPRNLEPRDLQDIADLVEPRAWDKSLHLLWRLNPKDQIGLPADPVRQVLMNLVLNAIQAAPEEGNVEVEVEIDRELGMLMIRVTNDGKAIPEQRLEHLFEPFTESSWGGSGLGLWITDQTVRQLSGRIQVQSDDSSTTFRVYLPTGTAMTTDSTPGC